MSEPNCPNLMENPEWKPASDGSPEHYRAVGPITFDRLCIRGFRTCSLTMTEASYAQLFYVPTLSVEPGEELSVSWCVRAVEASCIEIVAEFFDDCRRLVRADVENVTANVGYRFTNVSAHFEAPARAAAARVSLRFGGLVTAATFLNPRAVKGC